jgi:hypothetical protein
MLFSTSYLIACDYSIFVKENRWLKKLYKLIKIDVIYNLLQTISTNLPLNRLGESFKRKLSSLQIKLVLDFLTVHYFN